MDKFIPYEKLSKKKKRELDKTRRGTWTLNPVTRRPENPKAYNRRTARKWKDDSNSVPLWFSPGRPGVFRLDAVSGGWYNQYDPNTGGNQI